MNGDSSSVGYISHYLVSGHGCTALRKSYERIFVPFHGNGVFLVLRTSLTFPGNTFFSVKRLVYAYKLEYDLMDGNSAVPDRSIHFVV